MSDGPQTHVSQNGSKVRIEFASAGYSTVIELPWREAMTLSAKIDMVIDNRGKKSSK